MDVSGAASYPSPMSTDAAQQALAASFEKTEALFEELIAQQQKKVLALARESLPHLTFDDVLNPQDFPALKAHPTFEYEDGQLAGLIAAQIAFRARVIAPWRHGESK